MISESRLKFPDEADKIYAESVVFRELSTNQRFNVLFDLIASGEHLFADSPRHAEAQAIRDAEKDEWRKKIKELFARYGS